MKHKYTHAAIKIGCTALVRNGYALPVYLRTTKNFYVDRNGTKYQRRGFVGHMAGGDTWSHNYLLIRIERARMWHFYRHMWE